MRAATLTAIVLVATASLAQAGTAQVLTFDTPAQAGPEITASNGQWLFLSLANSGEDAVDFALSAAKSQVFTRVHATGTDGQVNGSVTLLEVPGQDSTLGSIRGQASFPTGHSSIYLEAERIEVKATNVTGVLRSSNPGACVRDVLEGDEWARRDARSDVFCSSRSGALIVARNDTRQAYGVEVTAQGVTLVEWHHASVSCSSANCPSGGARESKDASSPAQGLFTDVTEHERMTSTGGQLMGTTRALTAVMGSTALDVGVLGRLRLPGVQSTVICGECLEGQTLQATGSLALRQLAPAGDGRLQGQLEGDIESARLDEAQLDPALFAVGAASVIVVTAIALVIKVLGAVLFTRRSDKDVLDLPRRRRIYDYIVANPGTTYREVTRNTKLANGTTSHNLKILLRAGKITEHSHGTTKRYFAKGLHGDWRQVAVLREPALRVLHDWIALHARATQGEILVAMAVHGWGRSTTQHRLARLVREGLIAQLMEGRFKRYQVGFLNGTPGLSNRPQMTA